MVEETETLTNIPGAVKERNGHFVDRPAGRQGLPLHSEIGVGCLMPDFQRMNGFDHANSSFSERRPIRLSNTHRMKTRGLFP